MADVERPAPWVGFRAAVGPQGDDPSLEVATEDSVRIALRPARVLSIERYFPEQGWGANLSDGMSSCHWILSPSEPRFQDAALWAADWLDLYAEPWEAAAVRSLVAEHDGG